jgi:hypothetical protein
VRISVDQFDVMSGERETQVHVWISPELSTSYYLPAGRADELKSMPWPRAVLVAHEYWAARVWFDSSRARKNAIFEWLATDENHDALYNAWRAEEIRRNPAARDLAAEIEKLTAEIERLTGALSQRHQHALSLVRRAIVGQGGEWTTHRVAGLLRREGIVLGDGQVRRLLAWLHRDGFLVRVETRGRRWYRLAPGQTSGVVR